MANQLVDLKYDSIVLPSEHPLIDVILDQFVRRGEPDKTYQGSAGLAEFTFRVAEKLPCTKKALRVRNSRVFMVHLC